MERPAPLDRLLTSIFPSLSLSLSFSFARLVCKPALPGRENKTTRERKRGGDEREVRATRKQSFSPLPLPFDRPRRCPPFLLLLLLLLLLSFQQADASPFVRDINDAVQHLRDRRSLAKSSSPRLTLAPYPSTSSSLARKRYEVVSRIPSKTRPRHSASGLHYHRHSC